MTILDKLSPAHKAMWAPTFSDLKFLTDAGVALLRGKANAIEEHAMAKMANPAKTAHLTKEQRGFLAFQSTLDRAATLLKLLDAEELTTRYDHEVNAPIPRDNLIAARLRNDLVGKTQVVNAYRVLQNARGIFIQLKAKYTSEALSHGGTLNLSGKPKRVTKKQEIGTMDAIRKMFGGDNAKMGEQVMKYLDNPAAYKLPEVEAQAEQVVLAAEAAASA